MIAKYLAKKYLREHNDYVEAKLTEISYRASVVSRK